MSYSGDFFDDDDEDEEVSQTVYIDDDDDEDSDEGSDDSEDESDDETETSVSSLSPEKRVPEVQAKRRRPYGPRKKKVEEPEAPPRPLSPVKLEEGMIETAQMRLQKRLQGLNLRKGGNCPICGKVFNDISIRTRHIFAHDNALSLLQMHAAERDASIIQSREQDKYDQILDEFKVLPVGINLDEEEKEEFIPKEVSRIKSMPDFRNSLINSERFEFRRIGKNWTKLITRKRLNKRRKKGRHFENEQEETREEKENDDFETVTVQTSELPPCIICLKTGKSLGLMTVTDFVRHCKFDFK